MERVVRQSDSHKQRSSVLNETEGRRTSKELSIGKEKRPGDTVGLIPPIGGKNYNSYNFRSTAMYHCSGGSKSNIKMLW